MAGVSVLADWQRAPCEDGIVLSSPDGSARIRIRPRVAAPSTVRHLLDRVIAEISGATDARHAPPTRRITQEGELAVIASAELTDRRTGCTVAIVGDEPCLCIEAAGAHHRELVSILVDSVALGLGPWRRRWFEYTPPAGWFGLRRAGHSVWLHPSFPRVGARITVFDARVVAATAAERLDRFLFARMSEGFTAVEPLCIEGVTSRAGLFGRLRIAVGTLDGARRMLRIASVHTDDRFSYIANLEAPDDRAIEQQFRDVLASFSPLPRPSAGQH